MGLFSARHIHKILILTAAFFLAIQFLPANDAMAFFEALQQEHDNEGRTVFRSLLIPSGGRAESLGSAYTGLADDIGFFEYNPAASSLLKETEAAVFHNSWIADSSVETIGFTQRYKDHGYGVMAKCFYVPFSEYDYFGREVQTSWYTESMAAINMSYNFLHGYTFKGIALGANLKTALRTVPNYADDETGAIIEDSGLSQSAVAFLADAGVLIRFNLLKFYSSRDPNFSMGLAAMNFGTSFTGLNDGMKRDDSVPARISAGLSYQILSPVTITAEFQQPVNLQNINESEHWAAGAGVDIHFTDFFAIQGGFLLKGGNPRFSLGGEYDIANLVTMNVNYTYDMAGSLSSLNRISVSLKTHLGDRGRAKLQQEVDEYYLLGVEYYAEGELDMAVELWEKTLQLDKRFDPAKKALQSAEGSIRVEQKMIDLQKID